jgi:hypothetical protein
MNIEYITLIESIYLIYMFFYFKTSYSFNLAIFDKETQNMGSYFVHDTGYNENKICKFGKNMAIFAIILAWLRVYYWNTNKDVIITNTIRFDALGVILALLMNMNAVVYILPLIISEYYLIQYISHNII